MAAYALRRIAWVVFTLFLVSVITFLIAFVVPVNPARVVAGPNAPQSVVNSIYHQLGLDKPLYEQYLGFVDRAIHGNFGRSYRTQQEVLPTILQRFPYTAELAVAGVIVELAIGVTTGIIVAVKRGFLEGISNVLVLIGLAVPQFWLGILLLFFLAYKIPIFPLGGTGGFKALILPALTFGITGAAFYTRMTRAGMLEVLNEDYIRTAKAKGLSQSAVILKHAFRNAMRVVVTMFGMDLGYALGGLLVIEEVFGWPGIGTLAWQAVQNQDIPMIMGTVLFASFLIVAANLVIDLLYPLLDPRVTYD
ncbi:ABC transporter permease [Rubrobacter naiadicus]|uniref:ABC transporter permease n=1 Tax=Rubrobacter naiadicus TaxID=1392641 RepID=UPI0023620C37|nr:ABC transporter permease [Rubrobacter naiadicus]